jgi:transcriptional regulator with XRE-family HTH domain
MPSKPVLSRRIFAAKLGRLMKEFDLSQLGLAQAIGVSQVKISRYLRGRNEPKLADFTAFCVYFNVSPEFFLDSLALARPMTAPATAAESFDPVEAKHLRDLLQTIRAKALKMKPEARRSYIKAWADFAQRVVED